MKRLLPFLAILPVFFAGTAFAAATLEIQVNGLAYANIAKFPRSAIPVIGISSTLGFTIHGGKAASPPRPPFGRDVQLTGQGTNPQPNSDQYNFFVTPLHTGTVTIPAFDIRTTAGESLQLMRPSFVMFGPAHLAMLALAALAPLLLAGMARLRPSLDRPIRFGLAALLLGGWIAWYLLFWARGWLTLDNGLPLNLCDWAAVILIVALITRRQFAYELGYFWGLGGSLQGLITPDIAYDFPDPQFIFFAVNHAGIITALLYLTFTGMRPRLAALPKVAAATLGYALVAGMGDFVLHTNYGFLAAKPSNASVMDFLSPWPWYIPELVGIGLLSLLIYYTPFLLLRRKY